MKVLLLSPGFPADMPLFTRGLARVGATVLGVGDQPKAGLAEDVAASLDAYLAVPKLWDEDSTTAAVTNWLGQHRIEVDRVECLWEPGVVLAAKLRKELGVPGVDVEQAIAFRDKETMKQVLDAAGIRTPHHYRASSKHEVKEAAEKIGFPVIVKPIDGAGSADTYTARSWEELDQALELVTHVPEVSVEEFVEGEEYTYDTISGAGEVLYENVCWYRPKPLYTRLNPWVSQQAICLRDIETPEIAVGVDLGRRVLRALKYTSGFAHMEWFRNAKGEAIFGEIGARSPGGRLTHGMNLACDIDVFTGWAEAICTGRLTQDTSKTFNSALVFKRAQGAGQHIARIEGLERVLADHGEHVPLIDLVPVGSPRRDWTQVVTGDGWMVARHPDLDTLMHIANRLSAEVRVTAG